MKMKEQDLRTQLEREYDRGEYRPNMMCPRCGKDRLNHDIPLANALSRYANVMICDECGMDEAIRDFLGNPLPLDEWAAVSASKEVV